MFVCLIEVTSQHGGSHLTKRQGSLHSHHSNQGEKENLGPCAALLSLPGRSVRWKVCQGIWGGSSCEWL